MNCKLSINRRSAPPAIVAPVPETWTKHKLFSIFTSKDAIINIKGTRGTLQSIQREDGSGSSFNLTILTSMGICVRVYVHTID
jgi:hypothetical protein